MSFFRCFLETNHYIYLDLLQEHPKNLTYSPKAPPVLVEFPMGKNRQLPGDKRHRRAWDSQLSCKRCVERVGKVCLMVSASGVKERSVATRVRLQRHTTSDSGPVLLCLAKAGSPSVPTGSLGTGTGVSGSGSSVKEDLSFVRHLPSPRLCGSAATSLHWFPPLLQFCQDDSKLPDLPGSVWTSHYHLWV